MSHQFFPDFITQKTTIEVVVSNAPAIFMNQSYYVSWYEYGDRGYIEGHLVHFLRIE